MQRFLLCFFALIQFVNAFAQNLSVWNGDLNAYYFSNDTIMLDTIVSAKSTATINADYLSVDSIGSWQFVANINVNTSDDNKIVVYPASDDAEMSNALELRIGTKSDNVALFKTKTLISCPDKALDKNKSEVFIRLERYAKDDSVLYVLYSNATGILQCEGSSKMLKSSEPKFKYFGIRTTFTKTNSSKKFIISSLCINAELADSVFSIQPRTLIDDFLAENQSIGEDDDDNKSDQNDDDKKDDKENDDGKKDDDIVNNIPVGKWRGMTSDYKFNEDNSITLNSKSIISPATIFTDVTTPISSWQFSAISHVNPSNSNMMCIALTSADSTFENAVMLNVGTNNDNLTITANAKTLLKTENKTLDKQENNVFVRIERYEAPDSIMYVLYSSASGQLKFEGYAQMAIEEEPESKFYGIQTIFSKTNVSEKFTITDIKLNVDGGDSIDAIRPFTLIEKFIEPQMPSPYRGSVAINEIMANPTDNLGLPNVEYVELYNTTDTIINLEGWSIKVDEKAANGKMPNFQLKPNEYAVLCASNKKELFAAYDNVCPIDSWPSLNNTEGRIVIFDCNNVVVDYIDYNVSMFDGSFKADGGWSLERIDATNMSAKNSNWCATENNNGGTPGQVNSIMCPNVDTDSPYISSVMVDDNGDVLTINYSEPMDTTSFENVIDLSGVKFHIMNFDVDPITLKTVRLFLSEPLMPHRVYDLINPQATDLAGNELCDFNIRLGLPDDFEQGDLIINEIMVSAKPNNADYVEILNVSEKNIDLSTIGLCIITDNKIKSLMQISPYQRIAFPHDYIVATGDSLAVADLFSPTRPEWIVNVNRMTNLVEEGTIAICSLTGDIYDILSYSPKMHSPMITSTTNVALERILTEASTSDVTNWTSASMSVNYATPTAPNSQNRDNVEALASTIDIVNKVFTPNGDGIDDEVGIRCNFGDDEWFVTLRIFSADGHAIAIPYNNQPMPVTCELKWDGRDSNGNIKAPGTYIIYLSAWSKGGDNKEFKKTCIISVDNNR